MDANVNHNNFVESLWNLESLREDLEKFIEDNGFLPFIRNHIINDPICVLFDRCENYRVDSIFLRQVGITTLGNEKEFQEYFWGLVEVEYCDPKEKTVSHQFDIPIELVANFNSKTFQEWLNREVEMKKSYHQGRIVELLKKYIPCFPDEAENILKSL